MTALVRQAEAFAGMIGENAVVVNKRTAISEETANSIRFGTMVAQGVAEDGALNIATNADVLKGVAIAGAPFAIDEELDAVGLRPKVAFEVLTRGPIRVVAEAAMNVGNAVHVRATANGGNTILGAFRATKDAAHTIDISHFARVVRNGDATTPPIIELDMLFAAAAVVS